MKREKVTKFNKFCDVPTHIFIDSLIPNYAKHLIDLINILCIDSSSAINISRMVDIITFEIILHNNRSHKIYQGSILENQYRLTSVRDFVLFCVRAGIIDCY